MIRRWMERAGLQRIESAVLALAVALPVGYLAFGEAPAFASSHEEHEGEGAEEHGGKTVAATPVEKPAKADVATTAALKEECGSCHIVFPANRLPAASWQKIMGNLGDHFGTDASIDDAMLVKSMTGYLVANAGDANRYQDVKGAAVPMRVTQTRWFVREHDEVRADAWKRPSIKSAANCGACHQGAADGNFSERNIRIPKQ